MLPLSFLKAAKNCPLLIELKNGETYNGYLVKCDSWMNINLQEVVCTSEDGSRFWRLPECYIKGTMIKYLSIPDEIYDKVKEDSVNKIRGPTDNQKNRGSKKGGKRGKGGHNRGARNQQRERL